MIDWRNINTLFVFLLCGNAASVFAASEPEMAWFKNEMVCADTKIIVRSYCEINENRPTNTICTEQTLTLERQNKIRISRNLLEYEPSLGQDHVAKSLRCVKTNSKIYLYIGIDNGGNCEGCETDAIIGLDGHWIRYAKQWYVPTSKRKVIIQSESNWHKQESFSLKNKIKD